MTYREGFDRELDARRSATSAWRWIRASLWGMLDLLTLILQRLATSIAAVNQQPSMASLRGLEGAGAAAYFEGFAALLPARLHFNGRNRRSPRDPANARLSLTSEQAFVIGYDISHPRRLLRVHREMCKHASLLEYSIFLLVGSDAAKDHCLQEIDALIEPQDDDVRCHALPGRSFQGRIGRANLPAEILWTGLPAAIACRRAQGANESDVLIPPSGYLQVNLQE